MSRQTIGRYLDRARQEGIVEIEIKSPLVYCTGLESCLETTFHLDEAIVVTPATETEEAVKEALGGAGAEFLQRRVQSGEIVGVAWSSSVLQCATRLKHTNLSRVKIVQMNGSLDRASYPTRAEYIVDQFAHAFDAEGLTLSAPLLVDRREIKESLVSDSRIAAALELAAKSSLVMFGVGDISKRSSLYKTGYVNDILLSQLLAAGAVGDICGRFFDRAGNVCLPEVDERTIAIDLESLKPKPVSCAVAGMAYKADAILAMLKGGFCNVLITDEETAGIILKG
jgi:deoxyribonucleoside regulator